MILIQTPTEAIKDLLSTTDTTIIGVLLAAIAILVYATIRKDKQLEDLNKYVRVQNKENLEVLGSLSKSLGGVEEKTTLNGVKTDKVETVLHDLRLDVKTILANGK
tara:strand:+ start:362 stop:679 length:318 start_codon:yes stop_codon:yes gene_type:complete